MPADHQSNKVLKAFWSKTDSQLACCDKQLPLWVLRFFPARLQTRRSVWTDLPSFRGETGPINSSARTPPSVRQICSPLIGRSASFSPIPQNNLLSVNTSRGLKRQHTPVTLQSSGMAAAAAAAQCQQAFSERLLTTLAFTYSFAASN